MRKALIRSVIILGIVVAAAGIGFLWDYVTTGIDKSRYTTPYGGFVDAFSREYGVGGEIIYAVMRAESGFRSDAVSRAGAVGLMQITPDTFDWLMTKTGEHHEHGMLYNPEINIKYGAYFLSLLYSEFGDWDIAFAAYNAGRASVHGWMASEEYYRDGKLVNIPYPETDNYVKKVNKFVKIYKRLYYSS